MLKPFVRDVAFPFAWLLFRSLRATRDDINTREIKLYVDGVAGIVLDIITDMHVGGFHKNLNSILVTSQKKAQEIVLSSPRICLDLGDRLTLGGGKHGPTQISHLESLAEYFASLADSSEGWKIWWVHGNHDRRISGKITPGELSFLEKSTADMWFQQIIQPLDFPQYRIRLQGMPCYNTQKNLYNEKSVWELIWNINQHSGVNIVMVHNPDGVRRIEAIKTQLWLHISVPTLFLCGHTHGLLGFQHVPVLGLGARKCISMERDTQYVAGYYPAKNNESYGIFVSRGMGDQAGIFRIPWGERERPILRFAEKREDADIVLGGR